MGEGPTEILKLLERQGYRESLAKFLSKKQVFSDFWNTYVRQDSDFSALAFRLQRVNHIHHVIVLPWRDRRIILRRMIKNHLMTVSWKEFLFVITMLHQIPHQSL